MKYLILIWLTVILVITCLLYLPFGYSNSTLRTFNYSIESINEQKLYADFSYLRHSFVFKRQIPTVFEINKQMKNSYKSLEEEKIMMFVSFEIHDYKILWHIVVIELVTIILITVSFWYTFNWYDTIKRINR